MPLLLLQVDVQIAIIQAAVMPLLRVGTHVTLMTTAAVRECRAVLSVAASVVDTSLRVTQTRSEATSVVVVEVCRQLPLSPHSS